MKTFLSIFIFGAGFILSCKKVESLSMQNRFSMIIDGDSFTVNNQKKLEVILPYSKLRGNKIVFSKFDNRNNENYEYEAHVYLTEDNKVEMINILQFNLSSFELKYFYSSLNIDESNQDSKITIDFQEPNRLKLMINGIFKNPFEKNDNLNVKGSGSIFLE